MRNVCTGPKPTITCKRSRSTISRITGPEWSNSRRQSERCDKYSGCESKGAMLSVRRTRVKTGCCRHMIRLGSAGGTAKWRVQDQEWRGGNHGGNEKRGREENGGVCRVHMLGGSSILVSYWHSGRAILPSAVYIKHLGGAMCSII